MVGPRHHQKRCKADPEENAPSFRLKAIAYRRQANRFRFFVDETRVVKVKLTPGRWSQCQTYANFKFMLTFTIQVVQ